MSSTAVATTAAVMAATSAHSARMSECRMIDEHFNSATATVVEKLNYASCINSLYSDSPIATSYFKIVFAVFLVSIIIGFFYALKKENDWPDILLLTVVLSLAAPTIFMILTMFAIGIYWLFE